MARRRTAKIDPGRIPASQGYLLVDSKKCSGCQTCMIACSLVHEGKINTKLARIQVIQDPYGHYPDDIAVHQCRQCVYPECLVACPVADTIVADTGNGNVRRIDRSNCIGCQKCVEACPYVPSRVIWDHEREVAQKCDLCIVTPYWDEKGGPDGQQACIQICPMEAIKLTREVPTQIGDSGYRVNLRGEGWPLDKE
ncbi:MAG: 4Fe-4S dicluster domain-containing protein [Candidatus Bathyanammoxibius sp.]